MQNNKSCHKNNFFLSFYHISGALLMDSHILRVVSVQVGCLQYRYECGAAPAQTDNVTRQAGEATELFAHWHSFKWSSSGSSADAPLDIFCWLYPHSQERLIECVCPMFHYWLNLTDMITYTGCLLLMCGWAFSSTIFVFIQNHSNCCAWMMNGLQNKSPVPWPLNSDQWMSLFYALLLSFSPLSRNPCTELNCCCSTVHTDTPNPTDGVSRQSMWAGASQSLARRFVAVWSETGAFRRVVGGDLTPERGWLGWYCPAAGGD